MKKLHNIFFVFVFLFSGLNSSISSSHLAIHASGSVAKTSQHYISQYSTQNIPGTTVVQIRHRSPHEVEEIAVPDPAHHILYTIQLTELEKQYLASWQTYFFVQDDKLPQSQSYPPTHSLRAPPFTC